MSQLQRTINSTHCIEFWFFDQKNSLFLAIYKTRNTGTGNRMREILETRGMFTRIPGNPLEDAGECSHFAIQGNARGDSGECSRRFRGMLSKIPRNVQEGSQEYSGRFRGIVSILN